MATINNSDTIKRIINDAKIQTAIEAVPTQLASKVVPVLISNPDRLTNWSANSYKDTSGDLNLETVSSTKRTFITGFNFSWEKDAACDCTTMQFKANKDGATIILAEIRMLSATAADSDNIAVTLPYPLEVDKGSTIRLNGAFTAGNLTRGASVFGFQIEP